MPNDLDELAQAVARTLKIERLRSLPGMDEVAVALNASPTYDEIAAIKRVLDAVQAHGYTVQRG